MVLLATPLPDLSNINSIHQQLNSRSVQGAVFPFFPFVEKGDSCILPTHLTFMAQCSHILKCNESVSPLSTGRMWLDYRTSKVPFDLRILHLLI